MSFVVMACVGALGAQDALFDGFFYRIFGSHSVELYFDSSTGVEGSEPVAFVFAYSNAKTHRDDYRNKDCAPLMGSDLQADAALTFGSLDVSTSIEVPDPNDADCANPSSPDCQKIPLEGGGAHAEVAVIAKPVSSNRTYSLVELTTQNAVAYDPGCGLSRQTPPGTFEPSFTGGAFGGVSATYELSQPRTLTVKITVQTGAIVLGCEGVIGCMTSVSSSADPPLDQISTATICTPTDTRLVWIENRLDGYDQSGEFDVTDDLGEGGGERDAVAELPFEIETLNEPIAVHISEESFSRLLLGDGDRNGLLDRCDLVLLRCIIQPGAQPVCAASYNVRLDMDLDGDIDSTDESSLIAFLPPVPGDATGDWKVTFADVTLILTNWSQTGVGQFGGDVNLDGVVNMGDLTTVYANYSKGVPNADPVCAACP
ncbi:MAG: hypothetical protein JNK58_13785 [Phycisphaerae bacterium]|nr:hypothetical protein [Phycisphaerae bacterium]